MSRTCFVPAFLGLIAFAPLRAQAPASRTDSTAADTSRRDLVPIGYGRQRAAGVTGAVATVNAAQFNTGRIVSPGELIQSKIAGVQVVDDDEIGGGVAVRIRGAASLAGVAEPLYVIDGMPAAPGTGGGLSLGRDPLNFLNASDIASITVLKGADAAAIYGGNGSNGVVLITTKSGEGRQGTWIDYGTSAFAASAVKLPAVLDALQFGVAVAEYAPARTTMLDGASTDWMTLVTHAGYGEEQNVSLTNAGPGRSIRLSFGYLDANGVVRGSSTERLSLGFNYDQHLLGDLLDVRANVRGARTNDGYTPNGALGEAATMAPTQPVYDPNNTQGFGTGYWDWNTSGPSASNPVAALNLATDRGTTWRSLGNVEGDLRMPFLRELSAHLNLGYDVTQADRRQFAPSTLADQMRGAHGYLALDSGERVNSLLEGWLEYAAAVPGLPGRLDATAGYSTETSHTDLTAVDLANLGTNLLGDAGVPTAGSTVTTKSTARGTLQSLFGRLGYDLDDRYLLSASLRRDRSTSPPSEWQSFPSVSVAWRLSREPLLRGVAALSDLKLRASWARVGSPFFEDVPPGTAVAPVDPDLKPQRSNVYDVGLDFGLMAQRVTGSVDWYTSKTTDLIGTVPIAGGVVFSNYLTTNFGSMRNTGIEATLGVRILNAPAHGLGWTMDFTAAHTANKLQSLPAASGILVGPVAGGVGSTAQILTPGSPLNSFYVCRQFYQNGKPVDGTYYYANGDSTFTSSPGQDNCDARGLRPYHDPAPTWILGHSSYLTYGRFDLSFTLRAYLGSWVYDNVASQAAATAFTGGGSPSNVSTSFLATGFTVPRSLSDYFVQDASFLRLDDVTLGYTFTLGGRSLRVYATVQNAFTITGYKGVDPLSGLTGIDDNLIPNPRIVTGGLSVRL